MEMMHVLCMFSNTCVLWLNHVSLFITHEAAALSNLRPVKVLISYSEITPACFAEGTTECPESIHSKSLTPEKLQERNSYISLRLDFFRMSLPHCLCAACSGAPGLGCLPIL